VCEVFPVLTCCGKRKAAAALGGARGTGDTKAEPATGKHLLFSFLTTDASPDVAPYHPDATPVLLLDEDAREMWMNAPTDMALSLQHLPPAGALKVVATGEKRDG